VINRVTLIPDEWDLQQTSGRFAYARAESLDDRVTGLELELAVHVDEIYRNNREQAREELIPDLAIYRSHLIGWLDDDRQAAASDAIINTPRYNDHLSHIVEYAYSAVSSLARFVKVDHDELTIIHAAIKLDTAADSLARHHKIQESVDELQQRRMRSFQPEFALEAG
jgi:hypothetical protein